MASSNISRREYLRLSAGGLAVTATASTAQATQTKSPSNPREVWSLGLNGMSSTVPAVHDGHAYVGSGDGELYKVSLDDHSIVASRAVEDTISLNGITAGSDGIVACLESGDILKLDADLNVTWRQSIRGYVSGVVHDSDAGYLCAGTGPQGDRLLRLDMAGEIKYSIQTGTGEHTSEEIGTTPAVTDEYVITQTIDKITVLDKTEGDLIADREYSRDVFAGSLFGPCVANGAIYAPAKYGKIIKFDQETCTVQWETRLQNSALTRPTTDGTNVYVAGDELYAISADDGEFQWSHNTATIIDTAPVVRGETIYMVGKGENRNREVLGFNPDGTVQWEINTGQTVDDTHEYVTPVVTNDGNLVLSREDRAGTPVLAAYAVNSDSYGGNNTAATPSNQDSSGKGITNQSQPNMQGNNSESESQRGLLTNGPNAGLSNDSLTIGALSLIVTAVSAITALLQMRGDS